MQRSHSSDRVFDQTNDRRWHPAVPPRTVGRAAILVILAIVFPKHTTLGLGVVVTGVRRRTPRTDNMDGMKLRLREFGDAERFVGLSYLPCKLWR
jgi:hypothetical protein